MNDVYTKTMNDDDEFNSLHDMIQKSMIYNKNDIF